MRTWFAILLLSFASNELQAQKSKGDITPKQEKKIFITTCTDTFIDGFEKKVNDPSALKGRQLKKAAKNYCSCSFQSIKSEGYTMKEIGQLSDDKMDQLTRQCLEELIARILPE